MARLAKQQPRRLWRESKYDLHTIAGGLPVECRRGEDYSCAHESFLVGLRRFAAEQDVIFRAEPVVGGDDQVGWTVQFFWNLYRSESRRTPPDFRHPSCKGQGGCSGQVPGPGGTRQAGGLPFRAAWGRRWL
jgi:hypothetical protein